MIGAQWGDEGKGKIVDWLAARADRVVRFQGGHNAGHTLVVGNQVYKLSLLPSGIVRGTPSVIGNGVVLDPWALVDEIGRLRGQGVRIEPDLLQVSDLCPLILPLHRELDGYREDAMGAGRIGTTRRGIGPAYEDKAGRRALRLCDLADLATAGPQIDRLLAHHDALRAGFGVAPIDRAGLLTALETIAPEVLPYAAPVWRTMARARLADERVLFEGAQGVLLDVDHGTYPFVTSSNTVSGQAATGSGAGPRAAGFVLGIVKAYSTRVGSGPFPTELHDATGERIGERGREFGTVTGRKRRVGWFDAAIVRQSVAVGGIDGIALTKLDVLDGLPELLIGTGYEVDGTTIDHLPASAAAQARAKPVYERFEGWSEATGGARRWADLPGQAVKYIRRVEELVGCPVALVSTSPEREDTILVRDPFLG